MTVDVLSTVRLLHKVFEFLVQQSPERLSGIAEGRCHLTLVEVAEPQQDLRAPAQRVVPPEPAVPEPAAVPKARAPRSRSARPPATAEAVDYGAIAAELRSRQTVDAGSAYLDDLRLRGRRALKDDLIGVGRAMGLTLPKTVSMADARRKLVDHAIGARKKYAGLESW